MKFTDKNRIERRTQWFTANPPQNNNIKKAKLWCDNYNAHPVVTGYYKHFTNTRWWFENEQDAIMFALTWSGR